MNINNKIIVITGGASGLGEATTRYLLSKGSKVAVFDLNAEKLAKLAKIISINLVGLYNVMSKCASAMVKNTLDEKGERGVIMNI